jgi:hypothetical protein
MARILVTRARTPGRKSLPPDIQTSDFARLLRLGGTQLRNQKIDATIDVSASGSPTTGHVKPGHVPPVQNDLESARVYSGRRTPAPRTPVTANLASVGA